MRLRPSDAEPTPETLRAVSRATPQGVGRDDDAIRRAKLIASIDPLPRLSFEAQPLPKH
ncbi:MAG: hypothetical protein AB7R67_18760 [Vicinamibacterales bacterium]